MGASVAALARGFAGFHPAVAVTGVVLNNVAGARHESLLRSACERSEEHTSELQSLMRISYALFCLNKKNTNNYNICLDTTCNSFSLHYIRSNKSVNTNISDH